VGLFDSQEFKSRGYVHYRLVQSELCRPLSEFTNSKHLASVVLCSVKACVCAFSDAGLFHRDASLGNIMIGLDNGGRLNDWDLCRGVSVDKSLEGPRTASRPLCVPVLVVNFICREPGSLYLPDYLNAPGQSTH